MGPLPKEFLARWLLEEPGTVAAAVVPSGAEPLLLEWLRSNLNSTSIELVDRSWDPLQIGAKAEELGRMPGSPVLLLYSDDRAETEPRKDFIQFWKNLNFQRERLASGNVRTCLLLSEDSEAAFASLAKDLWDWATFFRLPDSFVLGPEPDPNAAELPIADDLATPYHPDLGPDSPKGLKPQPKSDLKTLRKLWRDAKTSGLPENTVTATYAIPLFSALVTAREAEEAVAVWHSFRHLPTPGSRPEILLQHARDLMKLAALVEGPNLRRNLIDQALETTSPILQSSAATSLGRPELQIEVLSFSAMLQQKAGRYAESLQDLEACLEVIDRNDSDRLNRHRHDLQQRKHAVELVLRLIESSKSDDADVSDQIRQLLPEKKSDTLGSDVRQNERPYRQGAPNDSPRDSLGLALDLVVSSIDGPTEVISPLLGAWVLSGSSQLIGPSFEQIMRRDPVAYCRGIEALWQCWDFSVWRKRLIGPLAEAWAKDDEHAAIFRPELERWVQSATDFKDTWSSTLEDIAIRIFGERYDPTLIPVFCRHLAALPAARDGENDDPSRGRRRFDALRSFGFLLRWSYQEATIPALLEVAEDPSSTHGEVEAAKSLASTLLLETLPSALRAERPTRTSWRSGQRTTEKLAEGKVGIFTGLEPESLPHDISAPQIASSAGDQDIPDLDAEDLTKLIDGLSRLISAGRVKADLGGPTSETWIYDSWMPWIARCSPRQWWRLTSELLRQQADHVEVAWVIGQSPILGLWSQDPETRQSLQLLFERTLEDSEEGNKLRDNHGLNDILRWIVLADSDLLIEHLDAMVPCQRAHANELSFLPIPVLLGWSMDRSVFQHAAEARRRATDDHERHHWFMVEQAFLHRLPVDEVLVWCQEVLTLVDRQRDLRTVLIRRLKTIKSERVLRLLITEPLLGNPRSTSFQEVILDHALEHGLAAELAEDFPELISSLSLLPRGRYLAEIEDEPAIRDWGKKLSARIFNSPPDLSFLSPDVSFPFKALTDWAHLEPKGFERLAKEVEGWKPSQRTDRTAPFRESMHLTQQVVAPDTSLEARESMKSPFGGVRWTVEQDLPVFIEVLWSPLCREPHHRMLRIRYLSRCVSDKEIAWHGLAARRHGNYSELEEVGRLLLATNRQLDRQLGVSLLAWHPQADEILQETPTEDPSLRVREHAEWAIQVCRRERLGLQAYLSALKAEDWLHQQAQLEILRPLLLPTFSFWPYEHRSLIQGLIDELEPKRRALIEDFWYRFNRKNMWNQILHRDLEKYCRGEKLASRLGIASPVSGALWRHMRELLQMPS